MSFLIRLTLDSFVEGLPTESTVYMAGYTETTDEKAEGIILLTSNGGIEGGTIHTLRMRFELTETEDIPETVVTNVRQLLTLRGLTWSRGILLTEGLNETLKEYSNTDFHTPQQLEGWLAKVKDDKK
ncbi:MAG TPA: hypothetical protein VGO68_10250 [Pyrinomonadaceae bacterium]|jgi:hypothetical protein|nr:hypothetical protein [Pyrinomonadaceae bacterium]